MIPDNIDLDISLTASVWVEALPEYEKHITACFTLIVAHVPMTQYFDRFPHLEVSILLADDGYIQPLNRDYRQQDKATNVLSFPSLSEQETDMFLKQGHNIPQFPTSLGDIVFAYETIAREVRAQGKSLADHFCHLCLHGMLHLLGYDHVTVAQAREMEDLEKKLLSKLSIDDPYED